MKTGFKDPIARKEGTKVKDPWNFECPPYDERSSCFVNAGTNYGTGFKQPVGHIDNGKHKVDVLPLTRKKPLKLDHVYSGKPSLVETDLEE